MVKPLFFFIHVALWAILIVALGTMFKNYTLYRTMSPLNPHPRRTRTLWPW
nr:ATPase 8 [Polypedates leucomystax]